mmetsp:Transcript_43100/g.116211  ORF Transcript_43100/g.116211 Transcript_43100/m.116211 type:complete len:263 (+) Transcript_43100:351-1139(+)
MHLSLHAGHLHNGGNAVHLRRRHGRPPCCLRWWRLVRDLQLTADCLPGRLHLIAQDVLHGSVEGAAGVERAAAGVDCAASVVRADEAGSACCARHALHGRRQVHALRELTGEGGQGSTAGKAHALVLGGAGGAGRITRDGAVQAAQGAPRPRARCVAFLGQRHVERLVHLTGSKAILEGFHRGALFRDGRLLRPGAQLPAVLLLPWGAGRLPRPRQAAGDTGTWAAESAWARRAAPAWACCAARERGAGAAGAGGANAAAGA